MTSSLSTKRKFIEILEQKEKENTTEVIEPLSSKRFSFTKKIVSIIGCASPKTDMDKTYMTKDLFDLMVKNAEYQIIHELGFSKTKEVHLVSGGAAWADHIAVRLFLSGNYASLTLHLPCAFLLSKKNPSFVEKETASKKHWSQDQGQLANLLHRSFSKIIGRDSLQEILLAKIKGAQFHIHSGFRDRNDYVAASPYLIAYSWNPESTKEPPKQSGTGYTWKRSMNCKKKIHISLKHLIQSPK